MKEEKEAKEFLRYIPLGSLIFFVPLVVYAHADLWETFKAYLMFVGGATVLYSICEIIAEKIKQYKNKKSRKVV